ncbi:MAG: hypothetical protein AAF658_12195 [Myxococcota bacterium]
MPLRRERTADLWWLIDREGRPTARIAILVADAIERQVGEATVVVAISSRWRDPSPRDGVVRCEPDSASITIRALLRHSDAQRVLCVHEALDQELVARALLPLAPSLAVIGDDSEAELPECVLSLGVNATISRDAINIEEVAGRIAQREDFAIQARRCEEAV